MNQTYQTITIEEAHRRFQTGQLVIPPYQRYFVWDETQQKGLIESVLQGHFIGVILIAKSKFGQTYEIVDGQQRLRTISRFIENGFRCSDGQAPLSPEKQVQFLNMPLIFVTLSGIEEPSEIVDLFRVINTSGERLSYQELRRAGTSGTFAQTVEILSAELCSQSEVFPSAASDLEFRDCIWGRLGFFTEQEVRQGEDQVLIARLVLSILSDVPQTDDENQLNLSYTFGTAEYQKTEEWLQGYTAERLIREMKLVFSFFDGLTFSCEDSHRSREAFFLLYLAAFDLAIKKCLTFCDNSGLNNALNAVQLLIPQKSESASQYHGIKNYATWLLGSSFSDMDYQKISAASEFENSLRRAKLETARFEFKQGFLRLSLDRSYDCQLKDQILHTLCGMANLGDLTPSFLYIGIADSRSDAERIALLDRIHPVQIAGHYIVGIQREAERMNVTIEDYCKKIKEFIDHSDLSRHLVLSVLAHMEVFDYKGFTIICLVVPPQNQLSYCGDELYLRKYSNTVKLSNPREIVATAERFST